MVKNYLSQFWNSTRRWLPGAVISLAFLVALLTLVKPAELIAALRQADGRFLLAATLVSVFWLLVRGLVWQTLLRRRASYRAVFLTVCEGYLLNSFFPFRLGEVGRAFLISRKSPVGFMEAFSTIVIERVLDLTYSAGILLLGVAFFVQASGASVVAWGIGIGMLIGLGLLFLLARHPGQVAERFQRLTNRWPRLQRLGGRLLLPFLNGLQVLTAGHLFLSALVWMTFNWAIAILQFFLYIRAFYPEAQATWAFLGLGATAFGNAIPSLPGAAGTFEGAFAGALVLLSGDEARALATALTAHLLAYLVNGLLGAYAFSTEGETWSGIYRQVRKQAGRLE